MFFGRNDTLYRRSANTSILRNDNLSVICPLLSKKLKKEESPAVVDVLKGGEFVKQNDGICSVKIA